MCSAFFVNTHAHTPSRCQHINKRWRPEGWIQLERRCTRICSVKMWKQEACLCDTTGANTRKYTEKLSSQRQCDQTHQHLKTHSAVCSLGSSSAFPLPRILLCHKNKTCVYLESLSSWLMKGKTVCKPYFLLHLLVSRCLFTRNLSTNDLTQGHKQPKKI